MNHRIVNAKAQLDPDSLNARRAMVVTETLIFRVSTIGNARDKEELKCIS